MAHLFQDSKAKRKLGDKAPWSVGWRDPETGKSVSKRIGQKTAARKFARKVEGQIAAGTYRSAAKKSWAEFRDEFEAKSLPRLAVGSQVATKAALDQFEKIVKPGKLRGIKTQTIDDFVAKRRKCRGRKEGSTISPATVNKDLRHLKAVLRVAHDWDYLPTVPKVRMLREPETLIRYVTPEHLTAIYNACDTATMPNSDAYPAGDWWQALLVFASMTGWRIGEMLALRWSDVSLEKGEAITRHGDNKGKRDDIASLHPLVVEHLRRITDFGDCVFEWPHDRRTLDDEFHEIQRAAGICLDCPGKHKHTPKCHVYGFHDLRRAFATVNAETLGADALQRLMRHKSYLTTKRYVNMADRVKRSVHKLHVPNLTPAQTEN